MNEKTWVIIIFVSVITLCASFFWGGVAGFITVSSGLAVLFITKVIDGKKQQEMLDTLLDMNTAVSDRLNDIANEIEYTGKVILDENQKQEDEKRFRGPSIN